MPGSTGGLPLDELVRGVVPPWLVPVFYAITILGNIGVLLTAFTLDYWFRDTERGAHAISIAIGGMALVTALKFFFAVPRPPEEVNVIPITGYSFPSGHATMATVAYGILASDLRMGDRRVRFGVAALLVVLIALSRVVLGVHFVRDVGAGIIVGIGFLAAAILLTRHAPRPGFLLAVGLGVGAFVISGGNHTGVAVLGAACGAALAWEFLDPISTVESRQGRLLLLAGALPVLAVLGYAVTLTVLSSVVVFLLTAGVFGGILTTPVVPHWLGSEHGS